MTATTTPTVTRPPTVTAADTAGLPTAEQVIADLRAGRTQPVNAHPTTTRWTPAVHVLSATAAFAGLTAVAAYWRGHEQISDWTAVTGLFLTLLALLARAQEKATI